MELNPHNLPNLLLQLGLPAARADLDRFVQTHRLPAGMALPDAPFWNASQADFLRRALADDSDWAEAVDELARLLA